MTSTATDPIADPSPTDSWSSSRSLSVPALPVVRDYMATELVTVHLDLEISEAVERLLANEISGMPVVDEEDRLCGILSEKDCLVLAAKGHQHERMRGRVRDFMTPSPMTVPPTMDLYYLAGLFIQHVFRRFPVVENGQLVGQISRRDVLTAIRKRAA